MFCTEVAPISGLNAGQSTKLSICKLARLLRRSLTSNEAHTLLSWHCIDMETDPIELPSKSCLKDQPLQSSQTRKDHPFDVHMLAGCPKRCTRFQITLLPGSWYSHRGCVSVGAPAFAPGYAPSVARGSAPSGYARASLSPPAYGLSPASPTPTAYGSPSATPTAYGSPTATPIPSAPRQTPAAPQHTSPAEYAPPAEEDSPPSQWLSSDCEVVSNNADYPDGLQCSGKFPDPSCCSGDTCYTYSFWDSSKPHLAFAASEPHAGLGSCTGDYLIACCPAVVPE